MSGVQSGPCRTSRKNPDFPGDTAAPRRPRYKGTRKARLWRLRAKAIALALTLGAATSGCSLSYKLDSIMGKDSEKAEHTASVRPASAPATDGGRAPAENDLAYAKAAAAEVLARGEKDASQPLGKSRHRRTRHGDADRRRVHAGRLPVPRFPRELYPRGRGVLAAGRCLPHPSGQVDGADPAAAEADLISHCWRPPRCRAATLPPH